MKTILFACAAILLGGVGYFVWGSAGPDHHGQPFKGLEKVTVSELVEKPTEHVAKIARVEGIVVRQCPVTGCWFYLKDSSGKEVKIEMGDTTPTLPKRIGKTATVEGALVKSNEEYVFVGNALEFK